MIQLGLGLLLFFGAHFYSAFRTRDLEHALPQKIGASAYRGSYSLISALGLGLICLGFAETRATPWIYSTPGWARTGAYLLMLPSMVLLAAAYLPLGHLRDRLRHPMLIAIGLWSAGHLLTGANLPRLLLFGAFLAFSVIDFVAAERRDANRQAPASPPKLAYDFVALVAGAIAYGVVIAFLHRMVIGIDLATG